MEHSFDKSVALEILSGDEELLRRVAALFVADYETQLKALNAAFAAGDLQRLYSLAHSLKGSASSFGATRPVDAAAAVERCCRAGTLDAAAAHVADLDAATRSLADALVLAGLAQHPGAQSG